MRNDECLEMASKNCKAVMKRKRNVMTLGQKIELLDCLAAGQSYASAAKKFKLNESTVRTIKKSEQSIRSTVSYGTSLSNKATFFRRPQTMVKMEKALSIWIEDLTQQNVPVNGRMIQEKATRLFNHLKSNTDASEFKASKGWLERFKKRFSLHNFKIAGESACTQDQERTIQHSNELKEFIEREGCKTEKRFNDDEDGLLWKERETPTTVSQNERTTPDFKESDFLEIIISESSDEDNIQEATTNTSMTLTNIKRILSSAHQLQNMVFDIDPILERSLKFQKGLEDLLQPYKEAQKEIMKQSTDLSC